MVRVEELVAFGTLWKYFFMDLIMVDGYARSMIENSLEHYDICILAPSTWCASEVTDRMQRTSMQLIQAVKLSPARQRITDLLDRTRTRALSETLRGKWNRAHASRSINDRAIRAQ